MKFKDKIFNGDCLDVLPKLPRNSVDLIVTSPPYAQKRKKSYDGVAESQYVEWFLPIAQELKHVLKDDGSFVLNIKEPAVNAERSTFVIELILEMKKQGWLWTEEYIWHKRNSFPGKWPNRFRDAWERCLHFTKNKIENSFNSFASNLFLCLFISLVCCNGFEFFLNLKKFFL